MKSKMVSFTVEGSMPTLSNESFEALRRSSNRPDDEIDYSDIPKITDAQWRHAFPGSLRRFFRTHLMTKMDADILEWLRAKGIDHDLFVNDLLRREMKKEQSKEKQAARHA